MSRVNELCSSGTLSVEKTGGHYNNCFFILYN